jgi:hypothetical protein
MKVIESTDDIANKALRDFNVRWQCLSREGGELPHPEQVTGAFKGNLRILQSIKTFI